MTIFFEGYSYAYIWMQVVSNLIPQVQYLIVVYKVGLHCIFHNLLIFHWKKWPPFHRRHFKMHFHEWKILYFRLNFTKVSFEGSNWQYSTIDSDNILAPIRRQTIIWTNAVHWHIYAALRGDELSRVNLWCRDTEASGIVFAYVFTIHGLVLC